MSSVSFGAPPFNPARERGESSSFLGNNMKPRTFCSLLISIALLCFARTSVGEERQRIPKTLNEQVVMIPVGTGWGKVEIETTLFVPPGPGPFPLVVINHGKASGNPRFDPRSRYVAASREFLKRGYLVAIPMRPGFSKSGGAYVETGCNIESNGYLQAESVLGVLGELTKRPDVDPSKILVVGQSHGGLTAIAMGTTAYPGVKGILNFAGGLKSTGQSCIWEHSLVAAFQSYGSKAKIPSLWFYGDNDSYWGAELPGEMHKAFQIAGGKARLISYGRFDGGDAHAMFSSYKGVPIWWPETEKFLREIGLPTDARFEIETTPRPAKSDFAALDDVSAVPYLDDRRRDLYRKFLSMPYPRAFSIASTGNVGWAFEAADPLTSSLTNCEKVAKVRCFLYAVDDEVVWPMDKVAK
jgi:dienelactone hydrolase